MDPSPLTRGKLTLTHSLPLPHWLIPAHAGKTTNARPANQSPPAHPRSRGENRSSSARVSVTGGSSPLTRGKRKHRVEHRLHGGLIPAHAGKTQDQPRRTPQTSAHPRSRGENRVAVYSITATGGSSPLTRGKLGIALDVDPMSGLIPAHAGKTAVSRAVPSGTTAHPRSRGENPVVKSPTMARTGSSPLTRGKLNPALETGTEGRLIPAHAGKTVDQVSAVVDVEAHPRSRGENLVAIRAEAEYGGSSPLTRGKRRHRKPTGIKSRLIPAHAGKTAQAHATPSWKPAHPRSRGENEARGEGWHPTQGSSPLTRGKLVVPPQLIVGYGLIPAHAGKTEPQGKLESD